MVVYKVREKEKSRDTERDRGKENHREEGSGGKSPHTPSLAGQHVCRSRPLGVIQLYRLDHEALKVQVLHGCSGCSLLEAGDPPKPKRPQPLPPH